MRIHLQGKITYKFNTSYALAYFPYYIPMMVPLPTDFSPLPPSQSIIANTVHPLELTLDSLQKHLDFSRGYIFASAPQGIMSKSLGSTLPGGDIV